MSPTSTPIGRPEVWRSVAVRGEPSRADGLLRSIARRTGPGICRRCDGDGVVLSSASTVVKPIKCGHCGGEGLEPPK